MYRLGINTGFAVNRFSEPEVWTDIVGSVLGLRFVQLTADLLNPSLPGTVIRDHVSRIHACCTRHGVRIVGTFTGALTRLNHLAHPDESVRAYWVDWFKRFIDISVDLGARSMGSHFGIQTQRDDRDPERRRERRRQNIACWHELGHYARARGLEFLSWEPMSIRREYGHTIEATRHLHAQLNEGTPIPFKLCLDVDHGDVVSPNPADADPYVWLRAFAADAPLIHLKQSSVDKSEHRPFTAEHNAAGIIEPRRVIQTLKSSGVEDVDLLLELSFREREPIDSQVVEMLQESVAHWRPVVQD